MRRGWGWAWWMPPECRLCVSSLSKQNTRSAACTSCILCLLVLATGAPCRADFRIPDLAGWTKEGAPDIFNREDLYGYIDGGAELFLEFGFQELRLQRYARNGRELTLEAYRFADPVGALGIYLMRAGVESQVPGVEARATGDRHQYSAVKGDFYVQVNNFKGDVALEPDMVLLMNAALSGIPEAATRSADPLPLENRIPGSFRLLRGALALQSLYTLGEGDVLRFAGKLTGYAADYAQADVSYTLIVVPYPDAKGAEEAWKNLAANLDPELKPVSRADRQLVFEDFQKKYGEARVSGNEIRIRLGLAEKP
jgi:hypothetical protein